MCGVLSVKIQFDEDALKLIHTAKTVFATILIWIYLIFFPHSLLSFRIESKGVQHNEFASLHCIYHTTSSSKHQQHHQDPESRAVVASSSRAKASIWWPGALLIRTHFIQKGRELFNCLDGWLEHGRACFDVG